MPPKYQVMRVVNARRPIGWLISLRGTGRHRRDRERDVSTDDSRVFPANCTTYSPAKPGQPQWGLARFPNSLMANTVRNLDINSKYKVIIEDDDPKVGIGLLDV